MAYYFTEYKKNSSTPAVRQILGTATGANRHAYTVSYNTSTGQIDLYFDGTVETSTDFNPIGNWTQPFEPFWSGETHDNGDDIPGTSSNPTQITAMAWQLTAGGSWQNVSNVKAGSNSTHYGYNMPSSTSINIWTK
jgi:hypothetical protein